MSSLCKALIFFLVSTLFTAELGGSHGHSLLQRSSPRSEFNCGLSRRQLRRFSGGEEGRWLVTDSGLEFLEGDIQSLVNCTEEGDVLLFDVEAPIQPRSRTTIPWNLTLSAFVENPSLENGTFQEAGRKVTFYCPRENEGVFFVNASDCLFANFAFRDCSLNFRGEGGLYGIITTANCSTGRNLGTFGFHHLEFEANFLNWNAALDVQEPSCSNIQIVDLRFQNNSCIGICAAFLPSRTEIQNIALTGNRFNDEDVRSPILIIVHSGSNTTIYGLVASRNNGTVVYAQNANLSIRNSHILQNSGGLGQGGHYYTGGVTLMHSFGEILDSRFEENTGHSGPSISIYNSSIVIRRTSVVGCNATDVGGGISIMRSSTVRILDSLIANNSARFDGGGVYSYGARNLQIENTTFEMNSAEEGGGLYGNDLKRASLLSCRFIQNRVTYSGGGALFGNGICVIESNTFEENESDDHGGGLSCFDLTLNVSDTMFSTNNASVSGGGSYVYGNTSAWFANCTWKFNSARNSGGGARFTDGPFATIAASSLSFNQAEYGGGAYATNANVSLLDLTCSHNLATRSGAVIFYMRSVGTVSNCSFARNSAKWGGGFFLRQSETSISLSSFISNEALEDGGAIYCDYLSILTIEDSSFASNSVNGSGGAIIASRSVVSATYLRFQNNSASSFGGTVDLHGKTSAFFSHSVFFNESGVDGGAVSASESDLSLRNISIASCSAVSGGGINLYRSTANISEVSVTFCEATRSGGGIYMFESSISGRDLNISLNTALGLSLYSKGGGGITVIAFSRLTVRNVTLDGNRAQLGAGIEVSGDCIVRVLGGRFQNNSATNGGAADIRDSALTLRSVFIMRNSALNGGSVRVTNSSLTLNNSQLTNSSSNGAGGSILAAEGSMVVIERTIIQSSTAANGGGIMLIGSNFSGFRVQFQNCSARKHGGSVGLNETSSILCTDCLFEANSALQEGGALRLESAEPQRLAFQFEKTEFRNNDAAFGGAIYFQTGDGSANCSGVNDANCTFLALTGCVFTSNTARSVGGAIFANNPIAIRVSCDPLNKTNPFAYYTLKEFSTLSEVSRLDIVCDSWTENSASMYGSSVTSYARRMSTTIVFGPNKTVEVKSNRYVLHDRQSGFPLPTISLKAVDEFGQGPALIQDNQTIEAVMTSRNGLFAGVFIIRMEDSRGIFSGITAYQEPGNYEIQINFSERVIATVTIVVEIRQCIIGEWKVATGTLCELCSGDTYNFHPLRKDWECTPCPVDAKCDSTAIRPKKGFWHQTPCSSHVQRCLSERACDEEGRDTRLLELGSPIENCTFEDEFVHNYSEALCREGYTGPLCGSCDASHGRTRSFRCEECYGRFVNLLLVILVALLLLALTGFTIRSALPARKHPATRRLSRREESSSSAPGDIQMAEMLWTGVVPPEVIHPHLRTHWNGSNTAAAQQRNQMTAELAKWKAAEIFKITINYLQVIAIAVAVNVAWTGALIAMFETAEFIGAVTSEAAGRSTDCMTSTDFLIPRSAVTTIVNLIIPALVAVFFVLFWTVAMVKKKKGYSYLVKRCLLSVLVVNYLSYISVTRTAVNTLYCIDVHDSVDFENDSTAKYWAVDTALKCYAGSHTVLASVCGWPVLGLFTLGFPIVIACVLIMKRSQDEIQSPWLFETAGFLYRAYDERFIFWESIILLRKAALAVIVVFAYPLGGNLQGIFAVCVLMLALYLQLLCGPYRSEFKALNRLEGLSLLISSLTFQYGLFFNDENTSSESRTTVAAVIVFANVVVFFYFAVRFFVASATYLGIILESEGVYFDKNGTAYHIVKTFLKNRFQVRLGHALKRCCAFANKKPEESTSDGV